MKNPYEILDEIALKDSLVKTFMDVFPYYIDTLNRYLETYGYKLAACKTDEINYSNEESLKTIENKYRR